MSTIKWWLSLLGVEVSEVNVGGGVVEVALVLLEEHRQEEEKDERLSGEFEVYGWSLEVGFVRFEWKYLCCRDYG